MQQANPSARPNAAWRRFLIAGVVGFLGSVLIWVFTPYSNFIIRSSYIADSFLPPAMLAVALLLVLALNPLLWRFRPRWALDRAQLAVAFGLMLVAITLPSQGLLRMWPYAIARVPIAVRDSARLAEAYEKMNLPTVLFPAQRLAPPEHPLLETFGIPARTPFALYLSRQLHQALAAEGGAGLLHRGALQLLAWFEYVVPKPMRFGQEVPVSDYALQELPRGQSIPWGAWLAPLVAWGAFFLVCYMMMIGMAMIVYPQWRHNERLAFPLLGVYQEMIENPNPGTFFAPLFRRRSFWIAAGIVVVLHSLSGLSQYYPESVPAIPLSWDLARFFTEEPFRHLPGHIRSNRLYFIFVGIAFFMPNRIGFSVWFFVIAYGIHQMLSVTYAPPFYGATVREHRLGAMLALTVAVLWLGRAHWARVMKGLFRRALDAEERRNRVAGWMFVLGCLGMFLWMCWIGVSPGWALFFVAFSFSASLIITRLVAETGIPFIRLDGGYQMILMRVVPFAWLDLVAFWFSYILAILFQIASRVSVAVLAIHAVGLDEKATPRQQTRLAFSFFPLLAVGLVISGAAHLTCTYHYSMTLDGLEMPVSPWGTERFTGAGDGAVEYLTGRLSMPPYSILGHVGFGALLALVLQWACLMTPHWPIHPVGLLMVHTFYSNNAWPSVFLGWLLKVLLLHYGGVRVYRAARPVALGLIMGEVFAAVLWGLEPVLRIMLGQPYKILPIQPY